MAKKSGALKTLEEKRRKVRPPLEVDAIVAAARPRPFSRPAVALASADSADQEAEDLMRALLAPHSPAMESAPSQGNHPVMALPPPAAGRAGEPEFGQAIFPQTTVSPESTASRQDTAVLEHTVVGQPTVSPQNTVSPPSSASSPNTVVQQETVPRQHTVALESTVGPKIAVVPRATVVSADSVVGVNTVGSQHTVVGEDAVIPANSVSTLGGTTLPSALAHEIQSLAQVLATHPRIRQGVGVPDNFSKYDNAISDRLAPEQSVFEQAIYNRMYRLSWGYHRDACFAGYGGLSRACNMSKSSAQRAVAGLLEKGHIEQIDVVNNKHLKGTIYRVLLPREIADDSGDLGAVALPNTVVVPNTVFQMGTVFTEQPVFQATRETVFPQIPEKENTSKDIDSSSTNPVRKASDVRPGEYLAGRLVDTPEAQIQAQEDLDYIYSQSTFEQGEIFDAQSAWERWFPESPLPKAIKLDELLQGIRQRNRKGSELLQLFEHALKLTREKEPRDVLGWLTAGFREGYLIDEGIFTA